MSGGPGRPRRRAGDGPASWGKKMKARRDAAVARGEEKPCECWACLRAAGITPELAARDRHRDRYGTRKVMGDDAGGVPRPVGKKENTNENKPEVLEEKRQLRAAVANREVI